MSKFSIHATLAALGAFIFMPTLNAVSNDAVKPLFPVTLDKDFPDSAATFEEVRKLILEQYYSGDISEDALYYAAIEGMLRHVSPPETPELGKLYTPEVYDGVYQALKGVQVSIGVKSTFNANDGSLTVTEILTGSPAEGLLQPFDRILRVDGESLKGDSVSDVNDLLKGDEGTEVILTVNRDLEVFEVTVKRLQFETPNLVVTVLNNGIALVEMRKFTSEISAKFKEELVGLNEQGITGIIFDLRNNTGGVFAEALRTAEVFLGPKSIILRTYTRDKQLQNYISSNEEPLSFDVAVLVNKNTASAAEIVAGALQDHGKGIIVGVKTYGKGVFEKTFTLKNEYRVKFITGAMYTPKGKAWQDKGLTPDFLVDQTDGTLAALLKIDPKERFSKDVAMITAYKLLRK